MGTALVIVSLIGNLIPLVTQIISALQTALPHSGQGEAKKALVPIILAAAVDQQPALLPAGISKEALIALGTSLAAPMVDSMKTTGALPANLPKPEAK